MCSSSAAHQQAVLALSWIIAIAFGVPGSTSAALGLLCSFMVRSARGRLRLPIQSHSLGSQWRGKFTQVSASEDSCIINKRDIGEIFGIFCGRVLIESRRGLGCQVNLGQTLMTAPRTVAVKAQPLSAGNFTRFA